MPHPNAYADKDTIQVGDVVYANGSRMILGDVTNISTEGITVVWRETKTVEQPYDLVITDPRK